MTYGETIRHARIGKRITLRALARWLEVSAPYLSDVEHDRRTLSERNEKRACKALDLDPVLLEAGRGYTRELADWLKDNPELIRMLRESRRTKQPLRIGGECCPCRVARKEEP